MVSKAFGLPNDKTTFVPTNDTVENVGGSGTFTVRVAETRSPPAAFVTATVYVPASDEPTLVIVKVLVVTPAKCELLARLTPLVFHWKDVGAD